MLTDEWRRRFAEERARAASTPSEADDAPDRTAERDTESEEDGVESTTDDGETGGLLGGVTERAKSLVGRVRDGTSTALDTMPTKLKTRTATTVAGAVGAGAATAATGGAAAPALAALGVGGGYLTGHLATDAAEARRLVRERRARNEVVYEEPEPTPENESEADDEEEAAERSTATRDGVELVGRGRAGSIDVSLYRDAEAPEGHEQIWRYETTDSESNESIAIGRRTALEEAPDVFGYTGPAPEEMDGEPAEVLDEWGILDAAELLIDGRFSRQKGKFENRDSFDEEGARLAESWNGAAGDEKPAARLVLTTGHAVEDKTPATDELRMVERHESSFPEPGGRIAAIKATSGKALHIGDRGPQVTTDLSPITKGLLQNRTENVRGVDRLTGPRGDGIEWLAQSGQAPLNDYRLARAEPDAEAPGETPTEDLRLKVRSFEDPDETASGVTSHLATKLAEPGDDDEITEAEQEWISERVERLAADLEGTDVETGSGSNPDAFETDADELEARIDELLTGVERATRQLRTQQSVTQRRAESEEDRKAGASGTETPDGPETSLEME